MAATPSPNLNDQALLAADPTFVLRVQQALLLQCGTVESEADTTPYHYSRVRYATQILQGLSAGGTGPSAAAKAIALGVVTDTNVIGDATIAGVTPLTSGNVLAQGALVTDAHLEAAVANVFNFYITKLA